MENYDPQLAARVWKRVTGETAEVHPDLQRLIEDALADAAAYLHLSRFYGPFHLSALDFDVCGGTHISRNVKGCDMQVLHVSRKVYIHRCLCLCKASLGI